MRQQLHNLKTSFVSRYREELAKGLDVIEAITVTGATASRAVFFSGVMVVLALAGMLIVPQTGFKSIATGAILVVVFAILASLTLLPAVLRLIGTRVNSLRIPFVGRKAGKNADPNQGLWHRVANSVMRHPIVSLVFTLTLLVTLAVPYFNINLGSDMSPSSMPDSVEGKAAYQILEDKFSAGEMTPALIVIDGDIESKSIKKSVAGLTEALAANDDFGPATLEVSDDGEVGTINVPLQASAQRAKEDSVDLLRDEYIPNAFGDMNVDVMVTGVTASQMDNTDIVNDYLPIVIAFVLGFSFLLLTVVFRSIVVPIKAIFIPMSRAHHLTRKPLRSL